MKLRNAAVSHQLRIGLPNFVHIETDGIKVVSTDVDNVRIYRRAEIGEFSPNNDGWTPLQFVRHFKIEAGIDRATMIEIEYAEQPMPPEFLSSPLPEGFAWVVNADGVLRFTVVTGWNFEGGQCNATQRTLVAALDMRSRQGDDSASFDRWNLGCPSCSGADYADSMISVGSVAVERSFRADYHVYFNRLAKYLIAAGAEHKCPEKEQHASTDHVSK